MLDVSASLRIDVLHFKEADVTFCCCAVDQMRPFDFSSNSSNIAIPAFKVNQCGGRLSARVCSCVATDRGEMVGNEEFAAIALKARHSFEIGII